MTIGAGDEARRRRRGENERIASQSSRVRRLIQTITHSIPLQFPHHRINRRSFARAGNAVDVCSSEKSRDVTRRGCRRVRTREEQEGRDENRRTQQTCQRCESSTEQTTSKTHRGTLPSPPVHPLRPTFQSPRADPPYTARTLGSQTREGGLVLACSAGGP